MLEGRGWPYAVVCGFRECALQAADGWVIFGVESRSTLSFEARDRDYIEVEDASTAVARRLNGLTTIMPGDAALRPLRPVARPPGS